jgi:NAD(P)-dependent dehydrogenase (short-subunit alcohol dehydrogenase family)
VVASDDSATDVALGGCSRAATESLIPTHTRATVVTDLRDHPVLLIGKLDILVNNAGRIIYKPIVEMTLDDWNWQMQTNSTGAFLHTREALKAMTPNKSGAIVNIASYAAYYAFPGISAYTASKGALAQLTRTAALEAIKDGIRVNAIGVGDTVTNLLNHFRPDGRAFLRKHGQLAPIGRAAEPNEIAEIVAFLASDRASFIVGSVVMADGGMSVLIGTPDDQ